MDRRRFLQASLVAPLAASLAGCGGGGSGGSGDAPVEVVELPMALDGVYASVEVSVNGQALHFLLDSGADRDVVSARTAARLGLKLSEGTVPGSGAGGPSVPRHWVQLDRLAVGDAVVRDSVAYVIPMPEEFTYDGVLGMGFFERFVPRLDYAAGRLRLTASAAGLPAPPPGATILPLQRSPSGKLLVQARVAGEIGWFSIDTGAFNAVTVFTPSVERLDLRRRLQPAVRMVTGIGTNGVTRGDIVRVGELGLGDQLFRGVVVELSLENDGLFGSDGWMGNLGGELWHRFAVTLDSAGRRLHLEPGAARSQPFVAPCAGLAAPLRDGRFVVADVVPGSPAADAGVQLDDELLALDGLPLAGDARMLRRALATPGGSPQLRLRDGAAAEREVTLRLRELI